jgi:hypothetical protein
MGHQLHGRHRGQAPATIAEEYILADRASVYRHAHALGFFPKRQKNIRADLERIIEKAGEFDVTASAVVAAVQAYAKINTAGEWIDKTETTSMNDLFDRMGTQELEAYAQRGELPEWLERRTSRPGFLVLAFRAEQLKSNVTSATRVQRVIDAAKEQGWNRSSPAFLWLSRRHTSAQYPVQT